MENGNFEQRGNNYRKKVNFDQRRSRSTIRHILKRMLMLSFKLIIESITKKSQENDFQTKVWNAKLTYIQIFIPIFKYLDLGTNHLNLSSNHLYLASNHLYLGTYDLKIRINDLYLGSNDLYISSNTTICTSICT